MDFHSTEGLYFGGLTLPTGVMKLVDQSLKSIEVAPLAPPPRDVVIHVVEELKSSFFLEGYVLTTPVVECCWPVSAAISFWKGLSC